MSASASPLWSAMVEAGARAILCARENKYPAQARFDWDTALISDRNSAVILADAALRAALGKLRESRAARYIATDDIDALLAEADEGDGSTQQSGSTLSGAARGAIHGTRSC